MSNCKKMELGGGSPKHLFHRCLRRVFCEFAVGNGSLWARAASHGQQI